MIVDLFNPLEPDSSDELLDAPWVCIGMALGGAPRILRMSPLRVAPKSWERPEAARPSAAFPVHRYLPSSSSRSSRPADSRSNVGRSGVASMRPLFEGEEGEKNEDNEVDARGRKRNWRMSTPVAAGTGAPRSRYWHASTWCSTLTFPS